MDSVASTRHTTQRPAQVDSQCYFMFCMHGIALVKLAIVLSHTHLTAPSLKEAIPKLDRTEVLEVLWKQAGKLVLGHDVVQQQITPICLTVLLTSSSSNSQLVPRCLSCH